MEFKVLLRTAKAEVLAFASAPPRRLVKNRTASVSLTENFRLFPRRCGVWEVSAGRAVARERDERLNGKKVIQRRRIPNQKTGPGWVVPRISEKGEGSRLPTTQHENTEEKSVVSNLLAGNRMKKVILQPARLASGLVEKNPSTPSRMVPHPTADPANGERQPQLQSHAITPAAGR